MSKRRSPDTPASSELQEAAPDRLSYADTAKQWQADNRDAIDAYNAEIRAAGVWSDGLRRW